MSKIDINICSCTSDCSELELLATNKRDNTKENLLEVAENTDLLEVKTGTPTSAKTKLFPKRDDTKLNKEDFESFTRGFNEFETKHAEEIKVLKREDTVLREKLRDKVNTTDLPDFNSFATKEELSDKVSADSLPDFSNFATNEELNKKANLEKLEEYATKIELEDKANTNDLPDFEGFATKEDLKVKLDKGDFTTQLDNKANISDLPNFENFATKEELSKKANINDLQYFKWNLLKNTKDVEFSSKIGREYVETPINLTPLFDEYGLQEYTISFDIKTLSTKANQRIQVYTQNSGNQKYGFERYVNVTNEFTRQQILVTPTLNRPNTNNYSTLAFYGIYDTGNFPVIKNIKISLGNNSNDKWSPHIEEVLNSNLIVYSKQESDNRYALKQNEGKLFDRQSNTWLDLFVVAENEIPQDKTGKLIFVKEV